MARPTLPIPPARRSDPVHDGDMVYDTTLAARTRELLAELAAGFEERTMFGGLTFMVNTHMACGVVKDDLMVKVGRERHDEAIALGAEEMMFTGRPMRGMVQVAGADLATDADLQLSVLWAVEVARAAPPKTPKPPQRAPRCLPGAASTPGSGNRLCEVNRTDRLYALAEELRAAGAAGRTSQRLAEIFEVSTRTIERDISALQQAGVPVLGQQGRRGGYRLDRSASLPPLNFTPAETAALAVALSAAEDTPFARDLRSALRKIVAGLPETTTSRARDLVDSVRILDTAQTTHDREVAETAWRGIQRREQLHLDYVAIDGAHSERDVDPAHLVVGPNGWYLLGWCHLRQAQRVFRLDRVMAARLTGLPARSSVAEPDEAGLSAITGL